MGPPERDRLSRSVISPPLRERMQSSAEGTADPSQKIVIELSLYHSGGLAGARDRAVELLAEVAATLGESPVEIRPLGLNSPYLAARLPAAAIAEFARRDREDGTGHPERRAVHRIWPDFPVRPLIDAPLTEAR